MIKIQDLNFKYKNGKEVLNNINLDINEGECICIIGKNGSGKSTLARLISGIDNTYSGKIMVDDIDVKDKSQIINLRKKIGIVFQNPENQIIFGNVFDDMSFGLKNMKIEDIEQRIFDALKTTGMHEYMYKDAYELSLGQKQRITIASVLAFNPKYIVLDEPTTMLDSKGKEDVYNLIKKLKKDGYTIIFNTNVMDEVMLADRIIVLSEGKIIKEFKKEKVIDNASVFEENDLNLPFVIKMIIELQNAGINISLKDYTDEELIIKIVRRFKND